MKYILILAIIISCGKKQEEKKKNNVVYHHVDATIKLGDCKIIKAVHSTGVKVVQFKNGNSTLSQMALRDASNQAIDQELEELRNMGLCE